MVRDCSTAVRVRGGRGPEMKKRNPALEEAREAGVWMTCPSCLVGFLDLHYCEDPHCKRLKCRVCEYVIDPSTGQWALPKKDVPKAESSEVSV